MSFGGQVSASFNETDRTGSRNDAPKRKKGSPKSMPKDDPNQFIEPQDIFEMNIKAEDPNDKLIIPNQPTEFDSEN